MKCLIALIPMMLILSINIYTQNPHVDVQGHIKARGNLNMSHPSDTSSLFLGRIAGTNSIYTQLRFNTFVGVGAGNGIVDGQENTLVGYKAGVDNDSGGQNAFFGYLAGFKNTTGKSNCFFGANVGRNNTTGSGNSFFGPDAGRQHAAGDLNSFFGFQAGYNSEKGSYNTYIGPYADQAGTDSLTRAVAIGYEAKVKCSQCAVIGGTGVHAVKVGIGTDNPIRTLDVKGELQVKGTNGTAYFQSSTPNSFIKLENNNGSEGGTSVGYLKNTSDKYAYIDVAGGSFGEMILDANGNMTILGTYSPSSDRNRKENITSINTQDILSKLSRIPISEWQFKQEDIRHIGPMAQDFYAAFGLGQGEITISTVDADGIIMAAVQALYQNDLAKETRIQNQQFEIADLKAENEALKERLSKIEAVLEKSFE